MKKIAALVAAAVLSGNAIADITGFTLPTLNPSSVTGGFSPFQAQGHRYGWGAFDDHWRLTVDEANPRLTFSYTNTFNPQNGEGAAAVRVIVTGPTVAGVSLSGNSPPCVVGFANCITRLTGSFEVSAGIYDLNVAGFFLNYGGYDVTATVVPEPATSALAGTGVLLLLLLLLLRNRRTTGDAYPPRTDGAPTAGREAGPGRAGAAWGAT